MACLGLSFPILEVGTFLRKMKCLGIDTYYGQGRGSGTPHPTRVVLARLQPQALPTGPTHPCCSLAAVFSLWALCCGKNFHKQILFLALCCPGDHWPPTYLLSWEVPASPGKPPSATLPRHLLLLKFVHSALWVDNGHKLFLQAVNLPYVGTGNPMSPESWPNLENGTINLWRLRKMLTLLPPESPGVTLNSAGDRGPFLSHQNSWL